MEENQNQNQSNISNDEVIMNTSSESNIPNVSIDETVKKVQKKRENNNKLRIILISIIGAIVLLIGLFLLFSHFSGLKKYEYNEEYSMYQYFSGVKVSYEGKVVLTNNGDITTVESKDGISNINDAPVYFQDVSNEVLTTKNMQLVIPRLFNKNYKLKFFTKLIYDDETNSVHYLMGKNKVQLEDSFLYDGNNLYLFLTNVVLMVNEKKYELSPLSYAIVNYMGEVEIYDKLNDKYHVIDLSEKDVVATMGDYNINLSTDMLSYKENSRLLIKSVDNLNEYNKDK